jgi:lipopolysaccharide transport system ATP-binding protein
MSETVIKIENLRKQYRLGTIGGGTLTADVQTWMAKLKGKENPNSKIGEENIATGEKFWALDGINLEVKKGEAVGIIGHNGAGKSTLLKILSRVTAPTEGTVKMKGRISSMLEVGTGFHPELTGRENIYMNGAILGMTKKEVDSKIDEIIEFSECRQFIDTPVKRYSSGMYVKLAFAVAAHLDAEIMVMDEVLAVGDMKFQKKCLGKMGDAANNEGKTVLYVSHNMNTIRQLCTRCIVLNHGKIIFDGDVQKAIEIYMGRDDQELPAFYDFEDVKRPSLDHGSRIFIHSFEFLDKKVPVYTTSEKIKFKIDWTANEDIENMQLYFAINYADSTVVGMTQSEVFADAVKGVRRTDCFEFDASNLVEGRYYFDVDIFSMNEYGAGMSYDHPLKSVFFEVENAMDLRSLNWTRTYWGSVRLNEMKLINK